MRKVLLALAVVGFVAPIAMATPGQSWILPVADLQGGGWNTLSGAGYGGADAYQASGMDGVRRVYWHMGSQSGMNSAAKLYRIEFFYPTGTTAGDWQPIESQISGSAGEVYPVDTNIPWAGMWGTNHEYIGSEFAGGTAGTWKSTGAGPHTPESDAYTAGANGTFMWLKADSYLYAKWDYSWSINRAWSALRVTEMVPEPISMLLFGLGGVALLRRKPRV